MGDGTWDCRISTPGNDAKTASVSDPTKISFAASRNGKEVRVSEIVTITATMTWYNFTNTYSSVPFVWPIVKENSSIINSGFTVGDKNPFSGLWERFIQNDYYLMTQQTKVMLMRSRANNYQTLTAIGTNRTVYAIVMGGVDDF